MKNKNHLRKLLVLTSSYPKYEGDVSGNFVYDLTSRLANNFEIHILAPAYKGSLSFEAVGSIKIHRHKQFLTNNIELAYGGGILAKIRKNYLYLFVVPFYFFYQFLAIGRISKKEKIRLIHAHWLIPQGFLAVIYKMLFDRKVKIVVTIHGTDINSFDNFAGRQLKRFILKRIDELAVVSNALKEKAIDLGYRKEVFVYPMGVDTKLFSPGKKSESIRTKYSITGAFLIFVGSLIEQKNIRHLIQAMPLIIKKHPTVKLAVVGDGNLKNEMIALAKELRVSENVVFTGTIPHNDLPPYFATADLLILPSFSEGFGLVIIEAMSCKTLAVTSNLGGIHDIISDGETGFYFKGTSKEAIGKKINFILQNKEKFEKIRGRGRQRVVEKFDWDIVGSNYINLLRGLC